MTTKRENSSHPSPLDRAAAAVYRAGLGVGGALLEIAYAHQTRNVERLPEALEEARDAREAADNALALLLAQGAKRPGPVVARDRLPLEALGTPATRALLDALEAAEHAGAAVDRERGWVDSDGEPIGFGETLGGMAYQLRTEIFGPEGRD